MLVHKTPFFYGWVIVAVVMLSGLLTTGITSWGLSVFVGPMEDELGWSRSTIFGALAIGVGVMVVSGTLLGPLGDTKRGPRILYLLGALTFGLTLIYMRQVNFIWQYILVFGVIGGFSRFAIIFPMTIIPKWFVRRRAMAIAWASAGHGLGPFFIPIMIQWFINEVGWRDAWLLLGIITLVLLVPIAALIHTSPEDVGLNPDGDEALPVPGTTATTQATAASEYSYTRYEAVRMPLFWLVIAGLTLGTFGIMGLIPHIIPFLRTQGFSANVAASSITAYAGVGVLMRFGWGFITNRATVRQSFLVLLTLAIGAITFLYTVTNIPSLFLAMMLVGLPFGGFWVLQGLIVPTYFGRRYIAGIFGLMQPFINGAMWAGPWLLSIIFDSFDSYRWVFVTSVASLALGIGLFYMARPVKRAPISQPAVTA
ncbi:MAG: MFS transporter [Chloroflexi bacterium]|nr:MFS transporter [Chloroflexota bacterium]